MNQRFAWQRRARLAGVVVAVLVSSLALSGCSGSERSESAGEGSVGSDGTHPTIDPTARAALEEGNTAYAAREYEEALSRYRRAAEVDARHPSPALGIYMAARALGDSTATAAARADYEARLEGLPGDGK